MPHGPLNVIFLENTFREAFKLNLTAEVNPICHLLALLGAHHILHVSGVTLN
jgi:hypothetical protein